MRERRGSESESFANHCKIISFVVVLIIIRYVQTNTTWLYHLLDIYLGLSYIWVWAFLPNPLLDPRGEDIADLNGEVVSIEGVDLLNGGLIQRLNFVPERHSSDCQASDSPWFFLFGFSIVNSVQIRNYIGLLTTTTMSPKSQEFFDSLVLLSSCLENMIRLRLQQQLLFSQAYYCSSICTAVVCSVS